MLALLLFLPVCYAEESSGKVCLNIPEPGVETVVIEHNCKKATLSSSINCMLPLCVILIQRLSIMMVKTNLSVFIWVKNVPFAKEPIINKVRAIRTVIANFIHYPAIN